MPLASPENVHAVVDALIARFEWPDRPQFVEATVSILMADGTWYDGTITIALTLREERIP